MRIPRNKTSKTKLSDISLHFVNIQIGFVAKTSESTNKSILKSLNHDPNADPNVCDIHQRLFTKNVALVFGDVCVSNGRALNNAAIPTAFVGVIRKMNFFLVAINPEDVFIIFPFSLDLSNGDSPQLLPLVEKPLGWKSSNVLLHQSAAVLIDFFNLVADDGAHSWGGLLENGLARNALDQFIGQIRTFVSEIIIFNRKCGRKLDSRLQHAISLTFLALNHPRRMAR